MADLWPHYREVALDRSQCHHLWACSEYLGIEIASYFSQKELKHSSIASLRKVSHEYQLRYRATSGNFIACDG